MATNGVTQDQHVAPPQATEAGSNSGSKDLPKDEVGWYFVEQYYTTLSKSPEKLHVSVPSHPSSIGQRAVLTIVLSYSTARNPNSSMARKPKSFPLPWAARYAAIGIYLLPVCSLTNCSLQAIQERIKALEFQNCKVCISNVDSQGSDDNIVIQVIGETSNKASEPKKFVQTFVLAKQPSGYFVLNDILRYINEETEEEPEDAGQIIISEAPGAAEVEVETEPEVPPQEEPVEEAEPVELDAVVVDQKLEEVSAAETEAPASSTDAAAAEPDAETAEPTAEEKVEPIPDPEKAAEEIAEEEAKKAEEPKDPSPTPAVPATRPAAPAAAEPEKPKEPPKPMTWASRAAAAAGPLRPAVPIPKTVTPPVPAQPRPPVPTATQPTPTPQPTESPAPAVSAGPIGPAGPTGPSAPAKDQGSEWQTAETKRPNRPQSMTAAPVEKEGTMAYIKYVTEKVRDDDLKNTLASYGELAYFDINRQKVCFLFFLEHHYLFFRMP